MAKEIYIDGNGNEQLVSGTINNADMLPIESGSSTNTKDYIDTKFNGLLKITRESTSYTVAANSGVGLTYSFITPPTGYTMVGIVGYSTNTRNVVPYAIGMTGSPDSKFALRNLTSSSITDTLDVYVLWAKTGTVV